jgi:hypothetical protein
LRRSSNVVQDGSERNSKYVVTGHTKLVLVSSFFFKLPMMAHGTYRLM